MSTARMQKEENAKQLREELEQVPHAILVDFKGLNVEWATDLRRKLRDGDVRFKVVKNSTVLRAVEDLPLAELSDAFVGQTAIAYTDGDIVTLARVLTEFADDFETPSFKAGVVDGEPISAEEFERLSKLPPREELIAKALYLMNYPLTGLATALNGIVQGFVMVLEQIRQQKEEAGEDEPETAAAAEEPVAEETAGDVDSEEAAADDESEQAPTEEASDDEAQEAVADDGSEGGAEPADAEDQPAEAEAAADEAEDQPAEAEAAADEAEDQPADAEAVADETEEKPAEAEAASAEAEAADDDAEETGDDAKDEGEDKDK